MHAHEDERRKPRIFRWVQRKCARSFSQNFQRQLRGQWLIITSQQQRTNERIQFDDVCGVCVCVHVRVDVVNVCVRMRVSSTRSMLSIEVNTTFHAERCDLAVKSQLQVYDQNEKVFHFSSLFLFRLSQCRQTENQINDQRSSGKTREKKSKTKIQSSQWHEEKYNRIKIRRRIDKCSRWFAANDVKMNINTRNENKNFNDQNNNNCRRSSSSSKNEMKLLGLLHVERRDIHISSSHTMLVNCLCTTI